MFVARPSWLWCNNTLGVLDILALWRKWLKRGSGFPAVIRRSGTEARNQRKLPEFDSRQGTNFLEKVLDVC